MQFNIKKQLKNYIYLQLENENQIERLARMKSAEQLPPAVISDGSQRQCSSNQRMAKAIENRLVVEKEMQFIIENNTSQMKSIREKITQIEDPMQREVLRLRYLDARHSRNLKWTEIAELIYGSDDEKYLIAIQRIHKKALENLNICYEML